MQKMIDGRLRIIVSTDYFSNDMHAWRQIELPDIRLTADGVSVPLRLANRESTYRCLDDSEFAFDGYKYAEYTLDERVDLSAFTLESGDARAEIALAWDRFKDAQQFYRHIVLDGTSSEEKIFEKVDTKAI